MTEPVYDVAHLGRVELQTPDLAASLDFFVDVLGMDVVERAGDSVFLRAWGDYERASLQLTAADRSGVGTIAWRTSSDAALARTTDSTGDGTGGVRRSIAHQPRPAIASAQAASAKPWLALTSLGILGPFAGRRAARVRALSIGLN